MKVGMSGGQLVALDEQTSTWVAIGSAWDDDVLQFLAGGLAAVRSAEELLAQPTRVEADAPTGLPFAAQSLRAFALWEAHMLNGAHGMVDAFATPIQKRIIGTYEKVTGGVFPALRLGKNYYADPQFYMSNHRSVVADGETIAWPSFASVVDFELELGVVIARQVGDCTPAEGLDAIGGFVVMNDWSARDTQWSDTRNGTFGGIVKAKTFAGSMSSVVVTADEVLPVWDKLRGRVRVNGEIWAEGSTTAPQHGLGEAVAYAARGEQLSAGDLLSTGTLPGCCGLEMRRFPQAGDEVTLEIDGVGVLTNTVGPAPAHTTATVAASRTSGKAGAEAGPSRRDVVVVTGCDSGIGKDLAREFGRRGCTVYATGLRAAAMADLAEEGLRTAELDVTDPASLDLFLDRLTTDGVTPTVLVNNAGFGAMGPVVEMPLADVRRQYEVNVFGMLTTTQKLAQPMIEDGHGTIVNIGSTSGVLTSPFAGIYCSTKAAVHALNDALRMELAPFGLKVVRVEPNQIRTSFGDTAASNLTRWLTEDSRYLSLKDAMLDRAQGSQNDNSMPSQEFAEKVVAAVLTDDPPLRLRLGRELYPYTLFKPFLPNKRIDAILSKKFHLTELAR